MRGRLVCISGFPLTGTIQRMSETAERLVCMSEFPFPIRVHAIAERFTS